MAHVSQYLPVNPWLHLQGASSPIKAGWPCSPQFTFCGPRDVVGEGDLEGAKDFVLEGEGVADRTAASRDGTGDDEGREMSSVDVAEIGVLPLAGLQNLTPSTIDMVASEAQSRQNLPE